MNLGYTGVQSVPTAVVPTPGAATVSNLLQLILSQSQELTQRTSHIAAALSGPVPQSTGNNQSAQPTPCVLTVLQSISDVLQSALSESERAQSALS